MTLAPERPGTESDRADSVDATKSPARERDSRLVSASAERHVQHKPSGKPDPTAHLSPAQVEQLGIDLDAMRARVMDSRGASDAAYIRKVITVQRVLELSSRAVLLASGVRIKGIKPFWWIGTAGLSVAKVLENMEIGHNVMHGQWDWMRDPKIHSSSWEWDNASPASQWKRSHNEIHHTYTNVLGRDNDLGYGILRVDEDQPWRPFFLGQPLWNLINAAMFEYSIAAYDLELGEYLQAKGTHTDEEKARFRRDGMEVLHKIRRQVTKDYVVHPLLSGPSWRSTMSANFVANLVRNVWTNTVIICGHFPEGIETFETDSIDGETRGEWYLRQMVGSGNIVGSTPMHIMTGNLSHQIEHHCFPDMPSNRLPQIAPEMRELMRRNGLTYQTGSLARQVGSVYLKMARLSLPNREPGRSRLDTTARAIAGSVRDAWRARRSGRSSAAAGAAETV